MSFLERLLGYMDKVRAGRPVETKEVPTINEAIASNDASIWIPSVVQNVLQQAAEPILVGANLLRQVRLNAGNSYQFMALGQIRAFEIDEAAEYPEQALAMRQMAEGRVSKKGLAISMTDEVIADSQWGIWGLHVEAAGRALARLKEEIIWNDVNNIGVTVFDNTVLNGETSGLSNGTPQNPNGSLHIDDLIDLVGQVVTNEYQPTDVIMHPLSWTIMAKDPIMRNSSYTGGVFNAIWRNLPKAAGGANANATEPYMNSVAPFGLNIMTSPFVPHVYTAAGAFNAAVQAGLVDDGVANAWATSIFCVDRNNLGLLLVKETPSTEEFDEPRRDIRMMKIRERYGVVILDDGYASAVAKNVVITKNYAAV
jgi:hypothetical protein